MSDILALAIELFRQYNVFFLAILLLLQGIGIPTGAGVLVMASGAFAFIGEFNIFLLFGEIWLFCAIGDSLGYWTWRWIGKFLLKTFPKLNKYLNPKLQKANIFFSKRGKASIVLTRFPLSALGALVNATAGITKYKFLPFIVTAILGQFIWVTIYLGLGYWFSDAWETISDLVTQFGLLLGMILLLIFFIYLSYRVISQKKTSG